MSVNYAVLVVEPQSELRDWLTQRLLRRGYTVTAVAHPRQALAMAMSKDFALAVVSADLPEIDCPTLVQRLQRLIGDVRSIVLFDDALPPALPGDVPLVSRTQASDCLEASLIAAISAPRHVVEVPALATQSV